MPLQIEIDPVPLTQDADGNVRVGSTRVTLESVLWLYKQGYGAEAIVEAFPTVSLSDAHSVIAYYLRHKLAVDEYLRQREIDSEDLRRKIETERGRGLSKAELLVRQAQRSGG